MKHVLVVLLLLSPSQGARSINRSPGLPIFRLHLLNASLGAMAAPQVTRPPLSKDEVLDLLKSSTPRRAIIATIKQRGIDFEPTGQFLNELRKGGADNELLAVLRNEWRPEIAKPLSDKDIMALVAENESSEAIIRSIQTHGIGFEPTSAYLAWLQSKGAKDMVIDVLGGMSPRPFSKSELLQSLPKRGGSEGLTQEVRERGIDFEPDSKDLQALRTAGARESLLQAVRDAKRRTPFVAPKRNSPSELKLSSALVSPPLVEGKEATLVCSPSDSSVPVFAVPNDLGRILTNLRCGEKVTFVEKVTIPPGIDKIRYADGKEGFVSNAYLESSVSNVTPPRAISKPQSPYTPEARRKRTQGIVQLWIVIDAQGNVSQVQESSKPLGDGLDESAIATVKTWKFHPATRDGAPVQVRVAVEVSFHLMPGKP